MSKVSQIIQRILFFVCNVRSHTWIRIFQFSSYSKTVRAENALSLPNFLVLSTMYILCISYTNIYNHLHGSPTKFRQPQPPPSCSTKHSIKPPIDTTSIPKSPRYTRTSPKTKQTHQHSIWCLYPTLTPFMIDTRTRRQQNHPKVWIPSSTAQLRDHHSQFHSEVFLEYFGFRSHHRRVGNSPQSGRLFPDIQAPFPSFSTQIAIHRIIEKI